MDAKASAVSPEKPQATDGLARPELSWGHVNPSEEITFVVDESGFLKSYNQAAFRFLGLDGKAGSSGLNVMDLINPGQRQEAACELSQCLQKGRSTIHRFWVDIDGQSWRALIRCRPLRSAGRTVGMVITMQHDEAIAEAS